MSASRRAPNRGPAVARAGYGLLLLFAPGRLLALGTGGVPPWADPTVRVLGARHVLQAAALAMRPELAGPGALVDLAHASTDVACAVLRPELRVPALVDTAIAALLAGASWSTTRDERRVPQPVG